MGFFDKLKEGLNKTKKSFELVLIDELGDNLYNKTYTLSSSDFIKSKLSIPIGSFFLFRIFFILLHYQILQVKRIFAIRIRLKNSPKNSFPDFR